MVHCTCAGPPARTACIDDVWQCNGMFPRRDQFSELNFSAHDEKKMKKTASHNTHIPSTVYFFFTVFLRTHQCVRLSSRRGSGVGQQRTQRIGYICMYIKKNAENAPSLSNACNRRSLRRTHLDNDNPPSHVASRFASSFYDTRGGDFSQPGEGDHFQVGPARPEERVALSHHQRPTGMCVPMGCVV